MGAMMTLAIALLLQDEFYKFKPETTWVYKASHPGEERVITGKVLGEKDGKVTLDWTETKLDGTPHEASEVDWVVKDGLLWVEARQKGEAAAILRFPVLKAGAKKDDTWSTDIGESRHHGAEEVKVAAGAYKDAVRTRLKIADGTLIDFYLVANVGLIKVAVVPSNGDTITFELKEFKPAK